MYVNFLSNLWELHVTTYLVHTLYTYTYTYTHYYMYMYTMYVHNICSCNYVQTIIQIRVWRILRWPVVWCLWGREGERERERGREGGRERERGIKWSSILCLQTHLKSEQSAIISQRYCPFHTKEVAMSDQHVAQMDCFNYMYMCVCVCVCVDKSVNNHL